MCKFCHRVASFAETGLLPATSAMFVPESGGERKGMLARAQSVGSALCKMRHFILLPLLLWYPSLYL